MAFENSHRRLATFFGNDFLSWFDRSYILDWSLATAAWFIGSIIKQLPPFEREFDISDPLIVHRYHTNQISSSTNWWISMLIPLIVVFVTGCFRRSAIDIHHGCLALWSGRGINLLITESLKNRVGRLRPDFLSRCNWDEIAKACTGNVDALLDGRRSFPSGHSATAFGGMTFLFLFLSGVTGAWCLGQPARARSLPASKLARMLISLAPLAYSTWVAVSRVEDYRHHKEDVIIGAIIGAFTATICYLIYWPNPFIAQATIMAHGAGARAVYTETEMSRSEYGYELAGMNRTNDLQTV